MGYTITIGNAIPKFSKDYNELWARWCVESASLDNAPTFVNDEMTGNSNERSPSYSGWSDFCDAVGLGDLFFDDHNGLFANHPGCKILTQEHLDTVQAALIKYQASTDKKPGFYGWNGVDTGEYDAHLARIIWLEWWMRWSLANCETPAIENT